MEFNDSVTTFEDYPGELERREIEVLIKLVPFIERDVEERCDRIRERREEEGHLSSGGGFDSIDKAREFRYRLHEKYAPLLAREEERLVRLRRAILERAERLFPELAAEEPQEDFRPVPEGGDGLCPRDEQRARGISYVAGVVPDSRTESL